MQADVRTAAAPDAAAPDSVTIAAAGRVLVMQQAGAQHRIDATTLRGACRCAACTAANLAGAPAAVAPDTRLTAAAPIGSYALNLAFSDGHARGVFPFGYLAELAVAAASTDAPEQAA